jgi:hypothetical protein
MRRSEYVKESSDDLLFNAGKEIITIKILMQRDYYPPDLRSG